MRRTSLAVGTLLAAAVMLGSTFASRAIAAPPSWLGVYTQEITDELREGMDYNGSGALVRRVVPGSPAARGGIQRGDIIVRVGSRSVDSPATLADVVGDAPTGTVDVEVVRNDQKRSLRVTLEARDESGSDEFETPAPPSMRHPLPPVPPVPQTRRGIDRYDTPRPGADMDDHDRDMDRHDQDMDDHDRDMDRHDHDMDLRDHDPDGDEDSDGDVVVPVPPRMEMFGGRGRLGVRVESLSPDLASYFGGRDTRGALVLEVTDGSAAKRAGIRAGDVITRLDDKRIESADDLIEAVRSGEGRVTVRVMRHGSSQSLEATLGAADRDMRIRRPEGFNFNWNGRPGARGSDPNRRIIIRGDEPRSGELSPKEREELRKQMEELREQMRQLRDKIRSEQDRE